VSLGPWVSYRAKSLFESDLRIIERIYHN